MLIFMDILMSNRSNNNDKNITSVVSFNINDMRITFFIGVYYLRKIYQGANTRTVEEEEEEAWREKSTCLFSVN